MRPYLPSFPWYVVVRRYERISEVSFSAAEFSPASIPSIAALIFRQFPYMAFVLALVLVFTG